MFIWYIVSAALGAVWVGLLLLYIAAFIALACEGDNPFKDEEMKVFSAALFVGAFIVLFHWIILLAIIPFIMVYGAVQTFKLSRKHLTRNN